MAASRCHPRNLKTKVSVTTKTQAAAEMTRLHLGPCTPV